VIDTARPSPQDLSDFAEAQAVAGATHLVEPRSVVALFAAPPTWRAASRS